MLNVEFYAHPLARPTKHAVSDFAQWLVDAVPAGASPVVTQGDKRLATPSEIVNARGDVRVVVVPGAETLTWALVSEILIQVAVTTALSYVLGALTASGRGGNDRRNSTMSSPNNSLGERDNRVRILERVEDIYGQVLSVPSLMMPTYRKYINHRQVEVGYYCVGRGYYSLTEIKDGDTLISDFGNASAAVYDPFTSPNNASPVQQIGPVISDPIQTVQRSVQIDGVTLAALNQLQVVGQQTFIFEAPNTLRQPEGQVPNFAQIAQPGQAISITAPATNITVAGPVTVAIVTVGEVTRVGSISAPWVTSFLVGKSVALTWGEGESQQTCTVSISAVSGTTATASASTGPNPPSGSGTYTSVYPVPGFTVNSAIDTVGESAVTVVAQNWATASRPATVTVGTAEGAWTPWYAVNDDTATSVWVSIVAAAGLYKDDGNGKQRVTVNYQLEVQALAGGPTYTVSSALSGATPDERAETLEYALPFTGAFRVRMQRTTQHEYGFNGVVIDEIKWTDLYSVSPIARPHFGNKTTIQTVIYATARSTASRQRQLNCKAFRKLPAYNGTSWSGSVDAEGRITSGVLLPTARAVDAMAAMIQDGRIGQRPISDIDLAQVWATQMQIEAWSPVCGEFNYTFDNADLSLEEMLSTVARAVFSVAYRQSGRIRLFFERAQSQPVALFSHRNKRPDSETVSRSFSNASEYDGVELSYRDRDSTQSEVIRLPLDGGALRYKKIDLPGVTHFTAAWYAANREMAKINNQRIGIDTEVTGDGRLVVPGSLVLIVDNTRFKSYDGEILEANGLTLRLSQPVSLGVNPTIVIKQRNGRVESIPVTAGADTEHVVLSRLPAEPIVTEITGAGGLRTEFSVADNDRRMAQRYLVQEVSSTDGEYVGLTAINYTDAYYAADTQPVPPKDSVINA